MNSLQEIFHHAEIIFATIKIKNHLKKIKLSTQLLKSPLCHGTIDVFIMCQHESPTALHYIWEVNIFIFHEKRCTSKIWNVHHIQLIWKLATVHYNPRKVERSKNRICSACTHTPHKIGRLDIERNQFDHVL